MATILKKRKTYVDVTKNWARKKVNDSKITRRNFIKINEVVYKIKKGSRDVIPNSDKNVELIAEWLRETFGGRIYINPEIKQPENIRTPDFIFRNKQWELKTTSRDSWLVIIDKVKEGKGQANNFIIDLSKSKITKEKIFWQINELYLQFDWVGNIIVKTKYGYNVFRKNKN